MAPGCGSNLFYKQQSSLDTVDSFEVLEQTVMKQKRLAKKKKCDLRMKILLKRTFDLVCDIMDRENGFENDEEIIDDDGSSNNYSELIVDERKLEECLENSAELIVDDLNSNTENSSNCPSSSSNSSNLTVTNNNLNATNYSHYSCDDNQLVPSIIASIPLPPYNEESDQQQEEQQKQQQQVEKEEKCLKLDIKSLKRKFELNINNHPSKKLKLIDQNVTRKNNHNNSNNKKKVNKHHKSKNNVKKCSIISVR